MGTLSTPWQPPVVSGSFRKAVQPFNLSERECEVAVLLVQGLTYASIAERLCVSMNTAKTHVRHIYRKMNINSRQELKNIVAASV